MAPPASGSWYEPKLTDFEVKETNRIRLQSDTTIGPEEKLMLEERKESGLPLKIIRIVGLIAILILVGWFLINY
jgi:hypothetical protein